MLGFKEATLATGNHDLQSTKKVCAQRMQMQENWREDASLAQRKGCVRRELVGSRWKRRVGIGFVGFLILEVY